MKKIFCFIGFLLPILFLSHLNGQDSAFEEYKTYKTSDPIPIKNVNLDPWHIEDAVMKFARLDEPSYVLAPAKAKGNKMSFEMIKPKAKFIVVWLNIKNNSSKKLSILPIFLKPCVLTDKEGKTYDIGDRMKVIGAMIPEVGPGNEKKFYLYFDVPKETKPASIRIDLIKSFITLDAIGDHSSELKPLLDKYFLPVEYDTKVLGIEWVEIPAGEFNMGTRRARRKDEKPIHPVYLDTCYISKKEVTRGQFKTFVKDTGYTTDAEKMGVARVYSNYEWQDKNGANWWRPYFSQTDNHPVVLVSWNDAEEFCKWLSRKTGKNIHLPTEAQWEKAARGSDGRKYPWGNSKLDGSKLNFADSNTRFKRSKFNINDGYKFTAPVGSYPQGASPYDVFDMAGNVDEWCSDWYSYNYYSSSPRNNPTGPSSGYRRVFRGGSWVSDAFNIRCACRGSADPSWPVPIIGFRLAQD